MKLKVPPPEERLCPKHGKPIWPSQWSKGARTYGCAGCDKEYNRSPKTQQKRLAVWNTGTVVCPKHPDRPASRSLFMREGKRRCASCSQRGKDGQLSPAHKRGTAKRLKIYLQTPKGKRSMRQSALRRLYGITADDFDKMFAEQGKCCKICRHKSSKKWHLDHDHKTGKVRGVLCTRCNLALGLFEDKTKTLYSAIKYLEESRGLREPVLPKELVDNIEFFG